MAPSHSHRSSQLVVVTPQQAAPPLPLNMTVTLRFNVRKDLAIQELQFETPSPLTQLDTHGFHVTTAHGPDLMENTKNATRYMIDWLVRTQGLSRSQAYILCGQVVDLKISSIVDVPNFIVSAYLPLSIFIA